MTNTYQLAIINTDDTGLRRLTHERMKVLAQFTSTNCTICEALAPVFEKLAGDEEYQGIAFVRLNSDENPVAKQLMQERSAPFFVSYTQGRLLECDTCSTEAEVLAQLDRLRALMPN
jgi:thiol-disulfide isomerase/thioredoxin